MLRPFALSIILFVLLGGAVYPLPVGALHPEDALQIFIEADGRARVNGHEDQIRLRHEVAGVNYTFDLSLVDDLTAIDVVVRGGVDVVRARQLVPEVDDRGQHPDVEHTQPHFFAEIQRNVTELDSPAHVVKFEQADAGFTTHLGVKGPGPAVLTLTRDVTPPSFDLADPNGITHFSFMQDATTDEYALAELRIVKTAGGKEVIHRTPTPALAQSFPIQGLASDTDYTYWVTFTDWAGNNVTSEPRSLRTDVKPEFVAPIFANQEPAADAYHDMVTTIKVSVSGQSPIRPDDVLFFVDKKPVLNGFTFEPDRPGATSYQFVYHSLAPLSDGRHSVAVQVTDIDGGEGVSTWAFHVGEAPREATAGPMLSVLMLLVVGAAVLRRRVHER